MPDKRSLDEVSTMAAGDGTHDSFDDLLVKVVRSPAGTISDELALGTELSGRFTIERAIGSGGMGTVYVARDQTLGRDVAVKVHHASGGATRLRREAIAMARLAHPNVVTVFEVGEIERRPFVVMEYVTGSTLRSWLAASPRTWREILTMLIAAGEGLAAAHAAGLVHRDFKPENILVGDDGRARVGDFGLARELDSKDDDAAGVRAATDKLMSPMTQTGAVLGTPAYMAPEQFAGAPVDPRADQFAFCVTVWEALWGQRPYPGSTFEMVHAAIESDTRTPMPHGSKVPVVVRNVLERGLTKDPLERYPNMRELLDALRATLRRRRVALLAGIATVAIAAVLVAFAMMRGPEAAPVLACADPDVDLGTFADDVPAKLRSIGQADAAGRVELSLHEFVKDYRATAKIACESQRDWSPELVAKSKACLAVAARAAKLALPLDRVTTTSVPHLIQTATQLPSLHKCVEPTYLAVARAVPDDPAQLDTLIATRAELEAAVEDAGSHGRVILEEHLNRLTASPAHDDPTVAAGISYVRGMLSRDTGKIVESEKQFTDAYYAARAIDDDEIASASLINLIAVTTDGLPDHVAQQTWMRTALADAARMKTRSPPLAARIYANVAHYADLAGELDNAKAWTANARALLVDHDPLVIDVLALEAAIAMETGHVDDGVATYTKAIDAESQRLGADHLRIGMMNADFAALLLAVDREDAAFAQAKKANAIIGKVADRSDPIAADAKTTLGAIMIQVDPAQARQLLEDAKATYIALYGARSPAVAKADTNLALIESDQDHTAKSIALNEEALGITEQTLGSDRVEVAEVLYNLIVSYRKLKDVPRALAAAKRCAAIFADKSPNSPRQAMSMAMLATVHNDAKDPASALDVTQRALALHDATDQVKAWLQIERARAMIALHRDPAEIKRLLATARTAYTSLNMPARIAEIDGLAATLH